MAPRHYTATAAVDRMRQLEGAPLASFLQRAIAFSFDYLLVAILFAVTVALGTWLALAMGAIPPGQKSSPAFDLSNWYTLIAIVIYHGVLNCLWGGQTLGKRIMRIRVVSTTHQDLSPWQAVRRALGYAVSAVELGFGFLQYFFAENRQTTHDRLAATVVIVADKSKVAPGRRHDPTPSGEEP